MASTSNINHMNATKSIATEISETPAKDIDLSQVPQQKVKAFIHSNHLYNLSDFASLRSFDYNRTDIDTFYHHSKTFIIKAAIEAVWSKYLNIHPCEAWKGEIVSFGFQYSKPKNRLTYIKDAYEGLEVGQIVFLNVSFIMGLVNIAVGHEISEVNEAEKTLATSYLNGGKSEGTQQIKLHATPEGYTAVTHHTTYKSNSKFRDKYLYPILHTQAIAAFHNNIKAALIK